MSFQENLEIEIESIFRAKGFKQLEKRIKSAKAEMASMNAVMNNARGIANMREQSREFQDRLDRTSFSLQSVNDKVRNMSVDQLTEGFGGFNGELKNNETLARRAKEQMNAFGGVIRNSQGDIARIGNVMGELTNQFDDFGAIVNNVPAVKPFEREGKGRFPMEQFADGGTGSINLSGGRGSGIKGRALRAATSLGILSGEMAVTAANTDLTSSAMSRMKSRLSATTAAISSQIPSLQALQMTLLGVQFQLLSLAFIFGGLMSSALGAVGIFKILGNTLKMFFLPVALELLGPVLDIQEALLGVDEGTRKMIGRIFAAIAAIAAIGSILAFVVNGFLSFISILKPVWILLKGLFFVLKSLQPPVLAAIAAFAAITAVFKKFGNFLGTLATIVALVIAVIIGYFLSIPIAIGLAVGAVIAWLWNMRQEIAAALNSAVKAVVSFGEDVYNALIKPFVKAFNKLIGNSIIPDIVNGIIKWLMKLPGAALDIGTKIVNNIVKGIKGIGNGIWKAFKKVLPDFVVDALEGAGNAVSGAVNSVGDFAGGAVNAAQNFAGGIASGVNNLFGGGDKKAQTNVQNNQINADVQVNNKEESPIDTGRKFGEGLAQGLNNQTSNISSGT